MKKGTVIFLILFSTQTFAQWKSYYPEGTTQKKKKNTQTDRIYNKISRKLIISKDIKAAETAKVIEKIL